MIATRKRPVGQIVTRLYGQEVNPEAYAICKVDVLVKNEDENTNRIRGSAEHSTISHDAVPATEFDFTLSNSPLFPTDLASKMNHKIRLRTTSDPGVGVLRVFRECLDEALEKLRIKLTSSDMKLILRTVI